MKHEFTLEFWKDDGWYVGKLREVPGVFSQGETLADLEENIADAYRMISEQTPSKPLAAITRRHKRKEFAWKSHETRPIRSRTCRRRVLSEMTWKPARHIRKSTNG